MGRGSGQWDEGDTDQESDGLGGPGQGRGGEAPEKPEDVGVDKTKVNSQLGKGTYVGVYSMKGDPPKGEAAAQYEEVRQQSAEHALDALSKQKVPQSHRDFVRDYFDAIRIEKAAAPKK